eukprot:Phypoly_transcript_08314.p1 GENE.Phypoly_transcript_08314~~Phypoly_transcript_08314.p1  ORF type:complete len:505 (+),score=101.49 Phypoly_transcript_08314:107-1516(+)
MEASSALKGKAKMEDPQANKRSLPEPTKGNNTDNKNAKKRKQEQGKKGFDMSKYHKRHIALKVAYIGWDYHGFASQENTLNTIEGQLFAALQKTCLITTREESHYTRCGRTDKGVSAFGQVIALHLRSNLTSGIGILEPELAENSEKINTNNETKNETSTNNDNKSKRNDSNNNNVTNNCETSNNYSNVNSNTTINNNSAKEKKNTKNNNNNNEKKPKTEIDYALVLNRVLPPEIRVINWAPVPFHFNARFSALYRTYKYFFVPDGLDLEAMKLAAKSFIGEHDFRNFCKMDVENVKSFTRVILSINVEHGVITLSGFAFLWHQVRCMVAVLFMVGKHLETPQIVETLLDTTRVPAKPIYEMASEVPLVLFDCGFEDLHWERTETGEGTSGEVQRKLASHFETISHELYLKSKVAGLMLDATRAGCASLPKEPPAHVPLLQRGTEDSLEMRLKKQQSKQTPKTSKWTDD